MITSTLNNRLNKRIVKSVAAMHEFGSDFYQSLQLPAVCYFNGQLGAGKTTFIQGLLQSCCRDVVVTSPTYNLVHEYEFDAIKVYHFDLYRLNSPEELDELGVRDMLHDNSLLLIEWPEMGEGFLPPADHIVTITVNSEQSREILVTQCG